MKEVWKDVIGYEGFYKVSNLGNVKRINSKVKSCLRHLGGYKIVKEHFMTPRIINKYYSVHLCKDGKSKNVRVHRLVATAFIPNPNNLPQINHKDENKLNNNAENLEWCSCKYNQNYGTRKQKRELSKTKPIQKINKQTGEIIETYISLSSAARKNDISFKAISKYALGKSKTSGGYIWKYV